MRRLSHDLMMVQVLAERARGLCTFETAIIIAIVIGVMFEFKGG